MEKLKQLIAYVGKRKGSRKLKEEDFVNILSYQRNWLPPERAREVFHVSVELGLLEKKDEEYEPTFEVKGLIIPLDFIFQEGDLERYRVREDVFTRILDHICRATGRSRKDVLMEINSIKKEMRYVAVDVAALIYCKEHNIGCSQFYEEVEKKILS